MEPDAGSGLPRFNMPLELGMFLGAQEYGTREQKRKRCLILDRLPYRYQAFCSDVAGQDIAAHDASAEHAIAVRDWLATWLCERGVMVPGEVHMRARYLQFTSELRSLCRELRLAPDRLLFAELRTLVQEWADEYA